MTEQPQLQPPRPNLGPEPLPGSEFSGWMGPGIMLLMAAILISILIALAWRARRARRKGANLPRAGGDGAPGEARTPHERWIELAGELRTALSGRFGPSFLAKTTEELTDEPGLKRILGPSEVEELIALLRGVDRLKFSEAGRNDPGVWGLTDLSESERLVGRLTAVLKVGSSRETPEPTRMPNSREFPFWSIHRRGARSTGKPAQAKPTVPAMDP